MVTAKDYGEYETAWCPGCGDFSILKCVKEALASSGLAPHQVLMVAGIGQAAKTPHYMNANVFNGLHGRGLPVATGAKIANPKLKVILETGDGCAYSEGGNHFIAAMRRNVDVTLLAHNNQVYGLTKGQASPTSAEGFVTKAQPFGVFEAPFNPVSMAVVMRAGFVARSFAGAEEHLTETVRLAVAHRGFSLVDILQPCVSFNHVNTHKWYRDRCKPLPSDYDPTNWELAIKTSQIWGDEIPIGVIYRNDRKPLDELMPTIGEQTLMERDMSDKEFKEIIEGYY